MAHREIDVEEPVKADLRVKRYFLADGSKRYLARFRRADGAQSKRRGFRTIPEAQQWLEDRNSGARQGREVSASAGRVTVGDLWNSFHEHKRVSLKPSALASLESSWATHVKPKWGAIPVAKVSAADVQSWVGALKSTRGEPRPASASVVIRSAEVLRGILGIAVRDKRIFSNPVDGVSLPRKPKGKRTEARRYLTHAEVDSLAQAVGADRGLIIYITAYCGLRFGETNGLRTEDFDPKRRRIRVVRTFGQDRAGGVACGHTEITRAAHRARAEIPADDAGRARQGEVCGRSYVRAAFRRPDSTASVSGEGARMGGGELAGARADDGRNPAADDARSATHGGEFGRAGRCEREGGAADAWARLGSRDSRCVRRSFRRGSRRRRRSARQSSRRFTVAVSVPKMCPRGACHQPQSRDHRGGLHRN